MWFMLLILLLTLIYIFLNHTFKYWKNRNVPGPTPSFIVGNMGPNFMMKKSLGEICTKIYNEYEGHSFVGIYKACTPTLLIREPDFLKNILVKDFKHFQNNDFHMDQKVDPIIGRNPFFLKGAEWKSTRSYLTAGFTSGKMKSLLPLIEENCKNLVKFIENQGQPTSGLEAKELFSRFTLDNVASCAFGIEGKCFVDDESEFRIIGQKFFTPGTWETIKFFMFMVLPSITKLISIKFVQKEVEDRLRNIVQDTIKYRKDNNITRNDYLNFLMELHKANKGGNFTIEEITAQSATFFVDGYETSSLVLSFLIYELSCNQEAQTKVRNEIMDKLEKNNEEISYETLIQDMPYLDACINESLRKNPVILTMVKICTESYTYSTVDTKKYKDSTITLEPGASIIIPNGAIQMDPTYFPDPAKYNPERFLSEKANNNQSLFLPFGSGPRICLGQRFGFLQVKIGIFHIIKNFKLTLNKNTKQPLQFNPQHLLLVPNDGIWINYEKIN